MNRLPTVMAAEGDTVRQTGWVRALWFSLTILLLHSGPLAGQGSSAKRPASETNSSTVVTLPFATRLEVPWAWSSPNPVIEAALRGKRPSIDASRVLPEGDGTWVILRPRASQDGEASLILMVMPTRVGQRALKEISGPDLAAAERNQFRPEAERAASNTGRTITRWDGTRREELGGRYGLVTRYSFTRTDGPPLRKETHAVYLGTRAIIAHVHLPAASGSAAEAAVRGMLASLSIGVDSL